MNPPDPRDSARSLRRRSFLGRGAFCLGGLALAHLLGRDEPVAAAGPGGGRWRGVITTPQAPVKARRVIHLCMAGGPSQFESFDWKPELQRLHGQPFPESLTRGQQLAQLQNATLIARGPFTKFQ